jgi:hypothetical protein
MENFTMPQETSQLGRTSPIAMATENSPQEARMPLAEEISMRIRTVWDRQATQLTPPTRSAEIGTSTQKSPPAPTVRRISEDHHSLPTSGIARDGPSSSGSNMRPPEDRKLSATHALLMVCQRLDESTRQCEDRQEKILKLMLSLSISIDEKLRVSLETTNIALESMRALLCKSQRLQRYSQYGKDPETQGKGKGREIPTLGRQYPLVDT